MKGRLFLIGAMIECLAATNAFGQTGAEARAAARRHREANEAKILREFTGLLSLPNVASNREDIRRNADHLMAMLRQRGATARIQEDQPCGLWPVDCGLVLFVYPDSLLVHHNE